MVGEGGWASNALHAPIAGFAGVLEVRESGERYVSEMRDESVTASLLSNFSPTHGPSPPPPIHPTHPTHPHPQCTALDLALLCGHTDVAELLFKHKVSHNPSLDTWVFRDKPGGKGGGGKGDDGKGDRLHDDVRRGMRRHL